MQRTYRTESVPMEQNRRAGNAYVEAKKADRESIHQHDRRTKQILVVADSMQNPAFVAADMLSPGRACQMASAVLVTEQDFARSAMVEDGSPLLPRRNCKSFYRQQRKDHRGGKIEFNADVEIASNEITPEHQTQLFDRLII